MIARDPGLLIRTVWASDALDWRTSAADQDQSIPNQGPENTAQDETDPGEQRSVMLWSGQYGVRNFVEKSFI